MHLGGNAHTFLDFYPHLVAQIPSIWNLCFLFKTVYFCLNALVHCDNKKIINGSLQHKNFPFLLYFTATK